MDESAEKIENVLGRNTRSVSLPICADMFRCFERPAVRKDRKSTEQDLFFLREQVMTPIDQCAQRLMTWQPSAVSACQQFETILDMSGDLFCREYRDARR